MTTVGCRTELHIIYTTLPYLYTLPPLFGCFTYTTLPSACSAASHTQLCLPNAHFPHLFGCFTYTTLPFPCTHFPTCSAASHTQLCLPLVRLLHIHNSAFPLFGCFTYTTLPSPCTHFPHLPETERGSEHSCRINTQGS